jgi:PDZ domain-containing protein
MTAPKHLWSGDWARESEEAAAEAAAARGESAPTAPAPAPPRPEPRVEPRRVAQPRPEPVRAPGPSGPVGAAPRKASQSPPAKTAPERSWRAARRVGTGALLVVALIAVAGVAIASGVFDRGTAATATSALPSNPSPTPAFAPAQPWMGLTATSSGTQSGALVTQVTPGGPAEQAGVQPGDVILAVNAQPISGPADIGGVIDALPTGSEVLLQIDRGGQLSTVGVTLAPKPAGTP